MKGKEKCKALKELRQKIAEENDIEYAVRECTHQGDCKGTCPMCESELRYLERELERRTALGKTVVLAGLSACMMGMLGGCKDNNEKEGINAWGPGAQTTEDTLAGEVEVNPTDGVATVDPYELDGDVVEVDPNYNTQSQSGTIEK